MTDLGGYEGGRQASLPGLPISQAGLFGEVVEGFAQQFSAAQKQTVCSSPRAPQAVSLAPEDHQTRLCDSVCLVSSQVQGRSIYLSVEQRCPCFACRSRGPTGEGRDRAGPSSRDEIRVL